MWKNKIIVENRGDNKSFSHVSTFNFLVVYIIKIRFSTLFHNCGKVVLNSC